jgi:hypothetical protein
MRILLRGTYAHIAIDEGLRPYTQSDSMVPGIGRRADRFECDGPHRVAIDPQGR